MTVVVLRYRCLKHIQMQLICSLIWHPLLWPRPGLYGCVPSPWELPNAYINFSATQLSMQSMSGDHEMPETAGEAGPATLY